MRLTLLVFVGAVAASNTSSAGPTHDCGEDWACLRSRAKTCGPATATRPECLAPNTCLPVRYTIDPDADGFCRYVTRKDLTKAIPKLAEMWRKSEAEVQKAMGGNREQTTTCFMRRERLIEVLNGVEVGRFTSSREDTCVVGIADCSRLKGKLAPTCEVTRCARGQLFLRCGAKGKRDECKFALNGRVADGVQVGCREGTWVGTAR